VRILIPFGSGSYAALQYQWRVRWLGAKPAHIQLTVRW
jgi:hypothetical protein